MNNSLAVEYVDFIVHHCCRQLIYYVIYHPLVPRLMIQRTQSLIVSGDTGSSSDTDSSGGGDGDSGSGGSGGSDGSGGNGGGDGSGGNDG